MASSERRALLERETTLHVQRAREGDAESLAWLVRKLHPLLLADARFRIGPVLGELHDPEDLVQDVWTVALSRLSDLTPRRGRYTPVLLKFLSTTLLNRVRHLMRKHIQGKPMRERGAARSETGAQDPIDGVPAHTTRAIQKAIRSEEREAVAHALAELDEASRQLILLRGVEQLSYKEIAAIVGRDHKVLAVEYSRSLTRLRKALPASVFDELEDD